MVSKKDLRKLALKKRFQIEGKEKKSRIIKDKLLKNDKLKESKNILIYVSFNAEVDTKELIQELLKIKKNVYVPKIIDQYMDFYKINSLDDLIKGHFNILEPVSNQKIDDFKSSLIIVPGLLFDKNNNRLGYGGGYYDKYLKNKNIYKIGICYFELLVDELETNEFDIKMDLVITER